MLLLSQPECRLYRRGGVNAKELRRLRRGVDGESNTRIHQTKKTDLFHTMASSPVILVVHATHTKRYVHRLAHAGSVNPLILEDSKKGGIIQVRHESE